MSITLVKGVEPLPHPQCHFSGFFFFFKLYFHVIFVIYLKGKIEMGFRFKIFVKRSLKFVKLMSKSHKTL